MVHGGHHTCDRSAAAHRAEPDFSWARSVRRCVPGAQQRRQRAECLRLLYLRQVRVHGTLFDFGLYYHSLFSLLRYIFGCLIGGILLVFSFLSFLCLWLFISFSHPFFTSMSRDFQLVFAYLKLAFWPPLANIQLYLTQIYIELAQRMCSITKSCAIRRAHTRFGKRSHFHRLLHLWSIIEGLRFHPLVILLSGMGS